MHRGIEISCNDPTLLSYLVEQEEWNIKKVENTFYLISEAFDGLTTPEEIRQAADEEIFVINGIMRLKFRYAHLIRGNTVATFDDQGNFLHAHISRNFMARAYISGGKDYFRDADASPLSSQQIWQLAQNNDLVREALQHYSNEHNWFNLNLVYEIVQKDTCRRENERAIKRGTFDKWVKQTPFITTKDFTQSAHRGRHSSVKFQPSSDPITYLTIKEGEQFVTLLLKCWLKSKVE